MLYKKDRTRHKRRLYDLRVQKRWLDQVTHPYEKEVIKSKIAELEHLTGQVSGPPPPPAKELTPEQRAEMQIDSDNKLINHLKTVIERIRSKEEHAMKMIANSKQTEEEIIGEFQDFINTVRERISKLEKQLKEST